jgi:enamine deaminase RidA (YjgF/YER057c/UK114 family)
MPTFRQPRAARPELHDRLTPVRKSEISVMPIERFMVPGELEPVSHYCHVVKAGDFIYLSGMVGMKANGIIPPDTVGQFEIALKSIDTCLRHAGGRPDQVVKVLIFMTDVTERVNINPIRQRYFGDHKPASTLVEVKALVDPRMKVEIEAVAYIGD